MFRQHDEIDGPSHLIGFNDTVLAMKIVLVVRPPAIPDHSHQLLGGHLRVRRNLHCRTLKCIDEVVSHGLEYNRRLQALPR
ncbi:hypothetical protein D3C76_937190 [compost metagenome]